MGSKKSDDQHVSPLEGEAFLKANRRKRDEAKAEAAKEAAKAADRKPGKIENPSDGFVAALLARPDAEKLVAGLLAACAVLAVLVLGLGIWGFRASHLAAQTDPQSSHGQSAMAAARNAAATLTTYESKDYGDLDRRIRELATSDFADKYIKSLPDARKATEAVGASSKGEAKTSGVSKLSKDKAEVLVALDQTLKSPDILTVEPNGHLYQSRVKVSLVRDGNRWLVNDFAVL
ncbi:MAG: hypothetical protein QM728_09305 [Gordonia sp. (in: high G+C Gram-positive bacteria)]|uniref:hypothetical protein n=1 Tax=Gordonia sp. (in: high G+C Gram-positive bacteria) TaxID=84139 RepID=UPI0039E65F14